MASGQWSINIGSGNGMVPNTRMISNVLQPKYRSLFQNTRCRYIDGLVQERYNYIANALELRLSCMNQLIFFWLQVSSIYILKQTVINW